MGQPPYPDPEKSYDRKQLTLLLKTFQAKKDTLGMAFCYLAYAKNQEKWNDPDDSPVFNFSNSIEMFRLKGDSINYYDAIGALGIYFMDRPIFRQFVKDYIYQAVRYFQRNNLPDRELGHLINLANVHVHEGTLDKAEQMLQRAQALNKSRKNHFMEGRIYAALSDLYGHRQNYAQTIAFAQKSLQVGKELSIDWLQAVSLYYIGRTLVTTHQHQQAIKPLMDCLNIAGNNLTLISLRREAYRNLGYVYNEMKDYTNATFYLLRMQETTDYIYNSKVSRDIDSFKDYLLLNKQKEELAKVALEKKLAQSELSRLQSKQQFYTIFLVLAICLAAASIYITVNQRRLTQLREEKVRKTTQIETLNALIQGQESERSRISQELHDGLGTLLSRIKMCMEQPASEPGRIIQMVDEACGEVRSISGNLQPNTLMQFGLIRAVQDLIIKQKTELPQIIFQHFGNPVPLSPDRELMIYRIVQELLTNALKHAHATEIFLEIVYQDTHTLCLTIEDDGVGFDETQVSSESNGWKNIRSRMEYLQGSLWLHSTVSVGTSVTIHIPIESLQLQPSNVA